MATPSGLKAPTWSAAVAAVRTDGLRHGMVLALAVALVSAAARVAVPIPGTPVPVTLQDLAVLVVGVTLGPARGAAALAAYVGLGAAGAPVFSNGHGGLAWLLGPTGGYLLAYPAAAALVGAAFARGRSRWLWLPGALGAQGIVYAGGVLQLAAVTGLGASAAIAQGVVPFLPGAALKLALLLAFAGALRALRPRPGAPEEGGGA